MVNTKGYQEAGKALDEEAQRLWSVIKSLRDTGLDTPETEAFGDLSSYDQHPADHGSETFEREKDLGLLLDTYQQLEQVAHARERLANGDYTACEECGWPIDTERLAALPSATLCIRCKRRNELTQDNFHRPVEEEVLVPPFGPRFNRGGPGFDAEDTWQAVAKFGTANSPQDIPDAIDFDDTYVNADEDEGLVEGTDAIIDLDYRLVSDQDEIYPDPDDNPRRRPHETDTMMPDQGLESGTGDFNPSDFGFTSLSGTPAIGETEELDADLWTYIRSEFPGDPEMEMADELTTEQMIELAREYDNDLRQENTGR